MPWFLRIDLQGRGQLGSRSLYLITSSLFFVFSVSSFCFPEIAQKSYGNFSKIILEESLGVYVGLFHVNEDDFWADCFQIGKTPTKITASQIRSFASFPRQFFGNNKITPPQKKTTLKQPNLEHGKDLPHSRVWSFQKTHTSSLCSRRETELKRKSILKASMKLAGWGKKGEPWTNQPFMWEMVGRAEPMCNRDIALHQTSVWASEHGFLRNCRWVNRKSSTLVV